MQQKINPVIYWFPRILSIIFVAFLALMSLDVFGESQGVGETLLALLMHNIPALILLVVLLISWKYEIVGGIAFILAGIAYIILTLLRGPFEWYLLAWIAQISGVAFLVGILFLVGWRQKKKCLQ